MALAFYYALTFLSTAAASALYSWIWYRPNSWKALVAPLDPCQVGFTICSSDDTRGADVR